MPDFDITLPDGRAVTVTAPDAGSAAKAAGIWANQGLSPAQQLAHADAVKAEAGSPGWLRALDNGALGNFLPEADASVAALQTGAHNLLDRFTGGPGAGYGMGDAFKAVQDVAHSQQAQYAQQHPVANVVANTAGAVLSPINKVAGGYVAGASTLPQAMARGAAAGGLIGGVYGAGAAGPQNGLMGRAQGAVSGAGTGAALGAVAPVVAAGVGAVARKAGRTTQDIIQGVRNTLSPPDPEALATPADTQAALQQVGGLLSSRGVDPGVLEGADPFGKGITTAEAAGRPAVASLGALARRQGATGDNLFDVLSERAQNAPSRILGDFADVTGLQPEEAAGNMEALTDRLRTNASPLFDKAFANAPGPVWNSNLAQLAQRPAIKSAIGTTANEMLNAGENPTALGFRLDPDTGWSLGGGGMDGNGGLVGAAGKPEDLQPQPTAEAWDRIRKNLRFGVERHPITGNVLPNSVSPGNRDLAVAAGDLSKELRSVIPGYGDALDASSDYLKLQSAFDRGREAILDPKTSATLYGKTFNGLSAPEQQAWKAGVAARLNEQLEAGRLKPGQLLLPHVQNKLGVTLGPQQAGDLIERLTAERALARTGNRMIPEGGSPSMEWLNAASDQDGGHSLFDMVGHLVHNPAKALSGLAAQGRTLGTSVQVRNELGRLLTQSPDLTAAELRAYTPPPPPPVLPRISPRVYVAPAQIGGGMIGAQYAGRR